MVAVTVQGQAATHIVEFRDSGAKGLDQLAGRNHLGRNGCGSGFRSSYQGIIHFLLAMVIILKRCMGRIDLIGPGLVEPDLCLGLQLANQRHQAGQVRLISFYLAALTADLLDGDNIPICQLQRRFNRDFPGCVDAVGRKIISLRVVFNIIPVTFQTAATDIKIQGLHINTVQYCQLMQPSVGILRKAVTD